MDLILYHKACSDGWCAAFIAKMRYMDAELIALDHGENHTEVLRTCAHRDVLMVDFSLPTREENDLLAASTRSFQIYDHHKTAQAVLEGAPYAVFDMKRSGAGLTWDYLFGKDSPNKGYWLDTASNTTVFMKRPWYVDYVEDRDLWNWKLPHSREICAFLGTLPFTIEAWNRLVDMAPIEAERRGEGALAHIQHFVRETAKQAQKGQLAGCSINLLNCTYLNCSEIGNELAKTADFSLTWFERGDNMMQFSLRSIGEYDVSGVAKRFGGGGHKNAAGFQMSIFEGRKLIDAVLNRAIASTSWGERQSGGCV